MDAVRRARIWPTAGRRRRSQGAAPGYRPGPCRFMRLPRPRAAPAAGDRRRQDPGRSPISATNWPSSGQRECAFTVNPPLPCEASLTTSDRDCLRRWRGSSPDLTVVTAPVAAGITAAQNGKEYVIGLLTRGRKADCAMTQMVEHLPRTLRHGFRDARDRALVVRRSSALETNLRFLHGTLQRAGLLGKTWVTGGLLLGWARLGHPLPTDLQDADFGFMASDQQAIRAGFTVMMDAGFSPSTRWRRNDGTTSEWSLIRGGVQFDFFEYRDCGDFLEVSGYFPRRSHWDDWRDASGDEIMQSRLLLPQQPLVPFELLERTWLKHEDHARELEALYGPSWRAPEKQFHDGRGWSTGRDSPSVAERTVWERSVIDWDGSVSGP